MEKLYTVVLDTKGSDNGAQTMAKGAMLALEKYPDLKLILVGDEDELRTYMQGVDPERVEYLNAPDVVTNYDNPSLAIYTKTESSLVVALRAAAEREDCVGLVNAGSTGALLAGSLRFLHTPEMHRPALAAVLPAEKGGYVLLVDTGATVDCTAMQLVHFARLGKYFMADMYGIENAKVGILSNGKEEGKGNKLVKEAYYLLKGAPDINFVGNVEGNVALSGECEVLVCDGFAGNIVLKNTEGVAKRLIKDIVKYAKMTGNDAVMPLVNHLMGLYDFNSLGGGVVLGVRKPVVKAHGAANEYSVVSTVGMILNLAKNKKVFD